MRSFAQGHPVRKLGLEPVSLKRILLTQAIYSLARSIAVVLFEACRPARHPSPPSSPMPPSPPRHLSHIFLAPGASYFSLQHHSTTSPQRSCLLPPLYPFRRPPLSSPLPIHHLSPGLPAWPLHLSPSQHSPDHSEVESAYISLHCLQEKLNCDI